MRILEFNINKGDPMDIGAVTEQYNVNNRVSRQWQSECDQDSSEYRDSCPWPQSDLDWIGKGKSKGKGRGGKQKPLCYSCGQPGHRAAQCTQGSQSQTGQAAPWTKGGAFSGQCYNCQGWGHRAGDCPSKGKSKGKGKPGKGVSELDGELSEYGKGQTALGGIDLGGRLNSQQESMHGSPPGIERIGKWGQTDNAGASMSSRGMMEDGGKGRRRV